MAHFAHINADGIVDNVIVIDQETLNTGRWGDPTEWKQTSYNTQAGKHALGGTPLRGNYAGKGMKYDKTLDAFHAPQPHASWKLDKKTFQWDAPKPMPKDGKMHEWKEDTQEWVERDVTV